MLKSGQRPRQNKMTADEAYDRLRQQEADKQQQQQQQRRRQHQQAQLSSQYQTVASASEHAEGKDILNHQLQCDGAPRLSWTFYILDKILGPGVGFTDKKIGPPLIVLKNKFDYL